MSATLILHNRQRSRPLNLRLLRQITRTLLDELLDRPDSIIGIRIVGAAKMARENEYFLSHKGSTDVITFEYDEPRGKALSGDILVCLDVALAHARRFRTSWQSELVRYIVHGALHLCGYDDQSPATRREMRSQENLLLAALARRFPLSKLAPAPPSKPRRSPH